VDLIRHADYRRTPWKNGGGETLEIAVFPALADLNNFSWRVSSAHVAASGPFSLFEGIDRTLMVIGENNLHLRFEQAREVQLDQSALPFHFSGDEKVVGQLVNGPVMDLNVMTRRGVARHNVRAISQPGQFEIAGEMALVFSCRNSVRITCDQKSYRLDAKDSAVLDADFDAVFDVGNYESVPPYDQKLAYLIDIWMV